MQHNIVGHQIFTKSTESIAGFDPATRQFLPEKFPVATFEMADLALQKATAAFHIFGKMPGKQRAIFLRAIAEEIENLGNSLIKKAIAETGLPEPRLVGERSRTVGQLRMFAQLLDEGSFAEAVIDTALPDRQPLPRADIRRVLVPTGSVVVFSVSNFPLAYSTAGGDVASALAAGCPVIVKAHESHPGTHALVADAVRAAAEKTGMPDGVFSSLFGRGFALGKYLVEHPLTKNVAFTGSQAGGRALFDMAAARPEPIPVFAEMSSTNPVFLLPEKISANSENVARQLAASININAGQFCTCPGLIFLLENADTPQFLENLKTAFATFAPVTMLNPGIFQNFEKKKTDALAEKTVSTEFAATRDSEKLSGFAAVASVFGKDFLKNPKLQDEVFGPFSLVVRCKNKSEMLKIAEILEGQLTATIWAADSEMKRWTDLFEILERKAGRLIFNGVPTGLEVCAAIHHGGPYPATTDGRFTAVGSGAIRRFLRPVCFQNFPEKMLPAALRNSNPLKIWRLVNGEWTKQKIKKG